MDEQTSDQFYAIAQNLLQVLVDSYRGAYALNVAFLRPISTRNK
ncbi:MAG: hypothetical protein AB8G95_24585 [Anaerolineae bacterium]